MTVDGTVTLISDEGVRCTLGRRDIDEDPREFTLVLEIPGGPTLEVRATAEDVARFLNESARIVLGPRTADTRPSVAPRPVFPGGDAPTGPPAPVEGEIVTEE